MRKLFAVCCAAVLVAAASCRCEAQEPPFDVTFQLSYVDAADREVDGTATMNAESVALDVMLIGDDGTVHFENVFPRVSEAGANPEPEVVVFYDDTGFLGGSLWFQGFGLASTEIEVGTNPSIEAGGITIWNQDTRYASTGRTGPAPTENVNVPEPIADVAFCLGMLACGLVLRKLDGNFSRLRPEGKAFQDETLTAA